MLSALLGTPGAPLNILCLGAHADDIEIGCGGTLLRLLAERPGSKVHWVVFSANEVREREARASAVSFLEQAGSATVEVLHFRDGRFPWQGSEIKDEFERLKAVAPEVVFTHRPVDLHQDHRTVGELTWNTFRNHVVLEYEIPKYEGDLGQPNVFVPLARATAERKAELILRHFASQAGRGWFTSETFAALLRLRGIECAAPEGVAEALYARKLVF